MALSKIYGDGSNTAGASAGVAFIFLFSGLYALFFNSTLYTIASEILPTHLRAQGMALTLFLPEYHEHLVRPGVPHCIFCHYLEVLCCFHCCFDFVCHCDVLLCSGNKPVVT